MADCSIKHGSKFFIIQCSLIKHILGNLKELNHFTIKILIIHCKCLHGEVSPVESQFKVFFLVGFLNKDFKCFIDEIVSFLDYVHDTATVNIFEKIIFILILERNTKIILWKLIFNNRFESASFILILIILLIYFFYFLNII